MDLQLFLNLLSRLEIQIGLLSIGGFLLLLLVMNRVKVNKLKKSLSGFEQRYHSVKTIPLPFKLNKAVALARVNDQIMSQVNDFKNSFEQIQDNLKSIANVLAETEDALIIRKYKNVKLNLNDLSGMMTAIEKQVNTLNQDFDTILEEENQQRSTITELKDFYRRLRADIQARSVPLAISLPVIEDKLSAIEKDFSSFEEWMYASEFKKAKDKMEEISLSLKETHEIILKLPELITLAKGIIPKLSEEIRATYHRLKNQNMVLNHLEIEKNLQMIIETTTEAENNLARCIIDEVDGHLHENQKRCEQLYQQLLKEESAHNDLKTLLDQLESLLRSNHALILSLKESLVLESQRFGWQELEALLKSKETELKKLDKDVMSLISSYKERALAASVIGLNARDTLQSLTNISSDLNHASSRLSTAKSDEERARKQLLKLHLIMNEIQVKIRKYRLPVISKSYEDDLLKSYQYISSIGKLLEEKPIDIRLLNATVNDGIDYIYKLYNNVNNLVGTVEMVENTIVYGNKFRPYHAELDSALTRAELLYKNGDYTQAVKVAIEAIEAINADGYEKLIKDNASSASA